MRGRKTLAGRSLQVSKSRERASISSDRVCTIYARVFVKPRSQMICAQVQGVTVMAVLQLQMDHIICTLWHDINPTEIPREREPDHCLHRRVTATSATQSTREHCRRKRNERREHRRCAVRTLRELFGPVFYRKAKHQAPLSHLNIYNYI